LGKISIRIKTCNSWVTIGFERKSPNFFAPSQPTWDWVLVMRRRGIGGTSD